MLFGQLGEPEALVNFTHQDQTAVISDTGTLGIDPERGVAEEMKRLILGFTHRVLASGAS